MLEVWAGGGEENKRKFYGISMQFGGPPQKTLKALWMATRMIRGLEHLIDKETLKDLGSLCLKVKAK